MTNHLLFDCVSRLKASKSLALYHYIL